MKMRRVLGIGIIFLLLLVVFVVTPGFAQTKVSKPGQYSGYSEPLYDGWKRFSQYVTVRDGTKIVTDIYRPTLRGQTIDTPHPGDIFGNDQFPFTYARTRDYFTGDFDSNLDKCEKSHTCPKMIHTDTETEIWSSGGSLVVTDTKGKHDVKLPKDVRAYMFTGAKHGAGGSIAPVNCQQLINPLDYTPLSRSILKALDKWVAYDIEPPPSRYPNLSDKTLVASKKLNFPAIPAFSYDIYSLPAVNYNALFLGTYWVDYSDQPPQVMGEYPVYAMKVNKDGNGVDGIRLPDITVPIATYTGWNRTKVGFGGDYRLCTASGSFIPFAKTKAERLTSGDPRLSIAERYPSHDIYVKNVTYAVKKLVHERFLLEEDAQKIIDAATASTIGNP